MPRKDGAPCRIRICAETLIILGSFRSIAPSAYHVTYHERRRRGLRGGSTAYTSQDAASQCLEQSMPNREGDRRGRGRGHAGRHRRRRGRLDRAATAGAPPAGSNYRLRLTERGRSGESVPAACEDTSGATLVGWRCSRRGPFRSAASGVAHRPGGGGRTPAPAGSGTDCTKPGETSHKVHFISPKGPHE